MAHFHIVRIAINDHHSMYDEIIGSLMAGFQELGHVCTTGANHIADNAVNILVGSTMFAARLLRLSDRLRGIPFVVYQLEPLHDDHGPLGGWPEYGRLLSQATRIWDYSPSGTVYLRHRGFPPVTHLPPAYHPSLETFRPMTAPDGDVLLVGSSHPRRTRVLNALASVGLRVMHLDGCYGRRRDQALARARIVLNIHAWDHVAALETVRLSYLLANGCFVISESADHNPYDQGVVYADYDALVATCLAWLQRPAADRRAVAERGYRALRSGCMADKLGRALADSFPTQGVEAERAIRTHYSARSGSLIWPVGEGQDLLAVQRQYQALRSAFADLPEPIDADEGIALYQWSREGSGVGDVLLAGDLPAGLSVWLAAGCRDAGLGPAVLDGTIPDRLPQVIAGKGLADWLKVCDGAAASARIRLLIVGGRSPYQECRAAMERWLSRVDNYGAVALHGVGQAPGATQLYDEVVRFNNAVKEVCRVGSVRVFGARSI